MLGRVNAAFAGIKPFAMGESLVNEARPGSRETRLASSHNLEVGQCGFRIKAALAASGRAGIAEAHPMAAYGRLNLVNGRYGGADAITVDGLGEAVSASICSPNTGHSAVSEDAKTIDIG